jgi:hypothetical protein
VSRPGCFLPPGKTRYPLYRRLGGHQGQSGQVQKILLPPRFNPWTVQPVASHYTDYTTWPTFMTVLTGYYTLNVEHSIVAISYYCTSCVAVVFLIYASNPDEFTRMVIMKMCYKGNYYSACSYSNSYNLSLLEMITSYDNENSS